MLAFGLLRFAVLDRHQVNNAGNLVVAGAGRNALRKFAVTVGNQLPGRMFLARGVDGDADPIQWAVIGSVSSAEDQPVVFFLLVVVHVVAGESGGSQQQPGQSQSNGDGGPAPFSNHCRPRSRRRLLRLRPRLPPQEDSAPAASW